MPVYPGAPPDFLTLSRFGGAADAATPRSSRLGSGSLPRRLRSEPWPRFAERGARKNRGLRGPCLGLGRHGRVPAPDSSVPVLVQELRPDLQEQVSAALRPAHLLFLHVALTDHLIHRGLDEGRRDGLPVPIPVPTPITIARGRIWRWRWIVPKPARCNRLGRARSSLSRSGWTPSSLRADSGIIYGDDGSRRVGYFPFFGNHRVIKGLMNGQGSYIMRAVDSRMGPGGKA